MKLRLIKSLDAVVEYMLYGAIFFIPISIALIGVFVSIANVLFLFKTILSRDFTAIKSNKTLFLLLLFFFIFMGLSLFNSGPLITKSMRALFLKWGRFPFLLWAIIGTFRDTKRITKAAGVILFSATLVGLTIFTQKFLGFEFLRGRTLPAFSTPVTGPFKNQNELATYLSCIIPIVLSFSLWRWKNIAAKLGLFLITGMLITSSILTFCRGGWVSLISGLIYIILVANCKQIEKWFVLIFFSTFIFFIPAITAIFYFVRVGGDSYRFLLARGAWGMIRENPFLGKGIGTFMDYCARYTNNFGALYAHNCYLQIWAESGIFSLLCFLSLVGYVFYRSIKSSLRMPKSLNFFLLIGLSAGLLGFLVHSLFDTNLYSFQVSFLFWIILGLTVASSFKLNSEQFCQTSKNN